MEEKILKEAELICEEIFPENEIGQCVLHHHLACFAEFVEVQALLRFRRETSMENDYKPEDIKHG